MFVVRHDSSPAVERAHLVRQIVQFDDGQATIDDHLEPYELCVRVRVLRAVARACQQLHRHSSVAHSELFASVSVSTAAGLASSTATRAQDACLSVWR